MTEPAAAVKSPCVNICALDEQDICTGCFRSAVEIALWTRLTEAQRAEVVGNADRRYREAWSTGAPR